MSEVSVHYKAIATNDRVQNDFYPTPKNLVTPLLDRLQIKGKVLEPCAGDGAIAQLIPDCLSNELYPRDFTPDWQLDASLSESWLEFGAIDWVVSNPPYNADLLPRIIAHSLQHAQIGAAMLLRLSWLEPCRDRAALLTKYANSMTDLIIVNPRPKFRSDVKGSDNATVAWFVWQKDFSWSRLGVRCPFGFLTDWRSPQATIQPADQLAEIAKPKPAISLRDRLLMKLGAEEFLDYMLRGGEYSQLDERAIALATNLRSHREELQAVGIDLSYGDSPVHAIGSLLRWHKHKVTGRQARVDGQRIWIYRIDTATQKFCDTAIASLGGSQPENSPVEKNKLSQKFCDSKKDCEGKIPKLSWQAGDRCELHLEGEFGMAIEIVEVLANGEVLCIDRAGRWRKPRPYPGEALQEKGTYQTLR